VEIDAQRRRRIFDVDQVLVLNTRACRGAAARGPIAALLAPPRVRYIAVGVTGHRLRGDALRMPLRRAE